MWRVSSGTGCTTLLARTLVRHLAPCSTPAHADSAVRALLFRFEAFGRPVKHTKKWEEGVFSDLRNLKPGVDACLEEPK